MLFIKRFLTVILVAWPVAAGAQGAPEKKDVHIAVGGKASFYYLPLTIAEQLGYFKDEGLNVSISDFAAAVRRLCGPSWAGARTWCRAPTSTP